MMLIPTTLLLYQVLKFYKYIRSFFSGIYNSIISVATFTLGRLGTKGFEWAA